MKCTGTPATLGLVVLVGVDGGLGPAPVVAVLPVPDQSTEVAVWHAVGPIPIPLVQRRTSQCETGPQVIENLVRHMDRGRLQREGRQSGQGGEDGAQWSMIVKPGLSRSATTSTVPPIGKVMIGVV